MTTFVTLYSGLIPMITTAGNTTNNGFVGAIVNDCFMDPETADEFVLTPEIAYDLAPNPFSIRLLSGGVLVTGLWMIVAPQARLGLPALRWMSEATFRGEALAGAALMLAGMTGLFGGRTVPSSTRRA